ncbi:MAG: PQQ-like beta-propeller repeat protein [Candidatus Symbiothrix sp.]|jgi:outer membrane protein assembly factor BamB|nr:PQQ-like beta-propeller repeat protein [Candidatus Symbiothrix sp.]
MKNTSRKITAVTGAVIIFYTGIIIAWHIYSPDRSIEMQNPGADNRPPETARKTDDVRIGEFFMRYEQTTSQLTGKWIRFRGESSSNIVRTSDNISIGQDDYPVLWGVETGEGHAACVIYNGFVFFLDYDELLSSDMLRCFSLETGAEQWRRWYRVPMKRNHGFSRTVPVIADDYIITLGPQGHLMCCNPVTGDLLWTKDIQKEYKTEVPFWYAGQCPRVDDGVLVLATAGEDVLLTGINCLTGETVWETPNTLKYKMSHSSVMLMSLHGKKTYVYAGIGGVCGVSAEKEDCGKLLWDASKWQPSVIAPSPLQLSSSNIFLVAGYGAGGALLKIGYQGNKWTATITEQYKANEGLSSEQQTPILYNDMIISILPKDGGSMRGKLTAYLPSDVHHPIWSSGAEERFGLGPYLVINNHVFVFKEDGELYVYEIKGHSMQLKKKQRIMEGADAWGNMAYADGRLIVRDAHNVKCIKLN